MEGREVKLHLVLRDLLEQRGYSRNRRDLLAAVGVTSAALSQYLTAKTRPSFERLVLLADYLGVSLDYLVYGQRTVAPAFSDVAPVGAYLRDIAGDLQSRASRHTVMVARIARALAEDIDERAAALIDAGANPGGMATDLEVFTLEAYSLETRLLSLDLVYDLGPVDPISGEPTPGMFTGLVADNLRRGRQYQFLVPADVGETELKIQRFRKLLRRLVQDDDAVSELCSIAVCEAPVFSGVGLYKIDIATLRSQQRLIFEQVSDYIDGDGWLGYVIPPNQDFRGDVLMSNEELGRARRTFEQLWRQARRA